ncbi:MAG: hypothetical protein JNK82_19005 [Myxococcaceae bacterium]|nr:hypothetical protein [Myxococcaceae bacterium]
MIHTARLGLFWGLGHSASLLGAGALLTLCGLTLPRGAGSAVNVAVAAMLLAVGARGLLSPRAAAKPRAGLEALAVGLVHGLGGSAALTLMLVPTLEGPKEVLAYLAAFGAGSIAGMVAVTLAVGVSLRETSRRSPGVTRWLSRAACSTSIAAGLLTLVRSFD